MESIEISLGDGWKRDVRYLQGLRDQRPSSAGVELVEIRDIVDIVVHGRNITSAVDEENIFSLLTDLTAAVAALLEGRSRKAIVAFDSEPWELVVEPAPPAFRLTLYSVDRSRQVVVHDVEVEPEALIAALCEAGSELIADLRAISPSLESHDTTAQLRTAVDKLKAWDGSWHRDLRESDEAADETAVRGTTSTPTGLSLTYELSDYRSLRRYGGEHPFDLHSLMCGGHLSVDYRGRRVNLGSQYPLFTLFDLLERIEAAIQAVSEPPGLPTTLEPSGMHGCYALDVAAEQWTIRAPIQTDAGRSESAEDESTPVAIDVPVTDCVEAVATLGEMMTEDVLEKNARQKLNHRLTRAVERVEDLRDWKDSRGDANLYHQHPEEFLEVNAGWRARRAAGPSDPTFPWSVRQLLGAYPSTSWRLEARRVYFEQIASLEKVLLVPTDAGMWAVDRATGHRLWEAEGSGGDPLAYSVIRDGVVTDTNRGILIRDLDTGRIDARIESPGSDEAGSDAAGSEVARSEQAGGSSEGGAGGDLKAARDFSDEERRRLVLVDRRGIIRSVDPETGSEQWRRSWSGGAVLGVATAGPLMTVLGEHGTVVGINPVDGELLWRVNLGRSPAFGPVVHQGRIYIGSEQPNRDAFTIHSLYPYTGRSCWQRRLAGHPIGEPVTSDKWMQVVRHDGRRPEVVVLDLESPSPEPLWSEVVAHAGAHRVARPTHVRLDGIDHSIFKNADRELTCRRMPDGHVRWSVELPEKLWELHLGVPPVRVRDALLVVDVGLSFRDVSSGEQLERLDHPVPAPEYLSAWGALSVVIGERDAGEARRDRLYRIDVDRFLAEVG